MCDASWDFFATGVHELFNEASYNRLKPPWDAANSAFCIVHLEELNTTTRAKVSRSAVPFSRMAFT